MHPQSRKFQTDRATVQGHLVHSSARDPEGINQGNKKVSLAIDAVLHIATIEQGRGISGH